MQFFSLIIGFVLLILGANLLVEGSVKVAKRFNISTMIISMTIIAIGTSIPELVIGCISSLKQNQITLSNNIGSIISTMTVSLGVSSFLFPVIIKKNVGSEVLKMMAVQVFLLITLIIGGKLSNIDGIIFVILFFIYLIYLIKKAKKIVSVKDEKDLIKEDLKYINEVEKVIPNSLITVSIFITLGIVFTVFGGNMVVDSATLIASSFGLSEALIGSTVVAFGTTLPELTTAIVAGRRKEYDIITGNIVGSGVSNILLIVGIASIIHPIQFTYLLMYQIFIMLCIGSFIYFLSKKGKIEKSKSIMLLLLYVTFVAMTFIISENI